MSDDDKIRQLMRAGIERDAAREPPSPRIRTAVSRARREVGQRDTLGFALVRIWAALARLLAPFFARLGEQQARTRYRGGARRRHGANNEQ